MLYVSSVVQINYQLINIKVFKLGVYNCYVSCVIYIVPYKNQTTVFVYRMWLADPELINILIKLVTVWYSILSVIVYLITAETQIFKYKENRYYKIFTII